MKGVILVRAHISARHSPCHFTTKVRKSFFTDLSINSNVSVVDLLYEQFYTGSGSEPDAAERDFMRELFRSEPYVKAEFLYHRTARSGGQPDHTPAELSNWTAYLDR